MPILVRCACGRQFNVPSNRAGQRGKCAFCQAVFVVPTVLAPPVPVAGAGSVIDLGIDTGPSIFRRRRPRRWLVTGLLSLFVLSGAAVMAWTLLHAGDLAEPAVGGQPAPPAIQRVAKAVGLADGLEPEQRAVREHFMKYADDPASLEFIEFWPVVRHSCYSTSCDSGCDHAVFLIVRERSLLGAKAARQYLVFLHGKTVTHVANQNVDGFYWRLADLYPGRRAPDMP